MVNHLLLTDGQMISFSYLTTCKVLQYWQLQPFLVIRERSKKSAAFCISGGSARSSQSLFPCCQWKFPLYRRSWNFQELLSFSDFLTSTPNILAQSHANMHFHSKVLPHLKPHMTCDKYPFLTFPGCSRHIDKLKHHNCKLP